MICLCVFNDPPLQNNVLSISRGNYSQNDTHNTYSSPVCTKCRESSVLWDQRLNKILAFSLFCIVLYLTTAYRESRALCHDDVIKWKHFPRYWPFVRGIHRSPVNSPHKSQWRGALIFTLICARINGWVNWFHLFIRSSLTKYIVKDALIRKNTTVHDHKIFLIKI